MKYQNTTLEDWIEKLYKRRLEIRQPQRIDMEDIADRLNIQLIFSKFNSRMFQLWSKPGINIYNGQSKREQREAFGHELCHVLRDAGNQMNLCESFRRLQECQAVNFALQFCVPTFMLKRMYFPKMRQEAVAMIADTFHITCRFADQRLLHFENQVEGMMLDEQMITRVAETNTLYKGTMA